MSDAKARPSRSTWPLAWFLVALAVLLCGVAW